MKKIKIQDHEIKRAKWYFFLERGEINPSYEKIKRFILGERETQAFKIAEQMKAIKREVKKYAGDQKTTRRVI